MCEARHVGRFSLELCTSCSNTEDLARSEHIYFHGFLMIPSGALKAPAGWFSQITGGKTSQSPLKRHWHMPPPRWQQLYAPSHSRSKPVYSDGEENTAFAFSRSPVIPYSGMKEKTFYIRWKRCFRRFLKQHLNR